MELFNLFAKLVLDSSEFQAGVTEAQSGAEDLASSLDSTGESFDGLAAAMIESGGVSSENLERLAELDAEYQKSQDEIKKLEDALAEMTASGDEASGGAQELSDMLDAEREHAAQLEAEMRQLVDATGEQANETDEVSKASKAADGPLEQFTQKINKIKGAVKALVAYKIAKWFWDTTDAVAQYGDHIDKASQKMNLSAEAYQKWSFIAEHSGTSIDGLKMSMKTLATQSEKNAEAFGKLGMSYDEIHKMSQEELFESTIKALQNVEDTTQRTVLATELLGRGAMELGPLFNSSGGDIDDMKKRLEDLGGVMTDTMVKKSAAYEDAMTDLQAAVQGAKNNIASFFMEFNTDVITAAANALGYLNRSFRDLAQMDKSPEEKLESMRTALAGLQEAYKEFENVDPIAAAEIQNQIDGYIAKINELEAEIAATTETTGTAVDEQAAKLAELQAAYEETFTAVSETLDGWFGAFDNATYEVKTSFDEMMANVQSQLTFWQEYEANLKTLADAGFGDLVDAIGEMGPAGAEYAEVLAGMATAGEDGTAKLQELQDAMTQVDDARSEAAETVTAIQFTDNSDESLKNIDSVKKAMEDLDGTTSTVYIETVQTGGSGRPRHAGGLDYVPYHDYPALLHEGERVLTKEENRRYSENARGYASSQPIQVNVSAPVIMDGRQIATQAYSFLLDLGNIHGDSLIHA